MAAASGKMPRRAGASTDGYLTGCINAMQLKDRLCNIETNCRLHK
jgi:hypothetical protein